MFAHSKELEENEWGWPETLTQSLSCEGLVGISSYKEVPTATFSCADQV